MKIYKLSLILTVSLSLALTACSNSNITQSKADDGATYGTGPNHTKPYPQSEKVNLNNVPGVTPRYEPLSKGGNKDYTVLGKHYEVWTGYNSYLEIGTASWYGPGFNGNKTSNGEVYNQKGYSAAHKNLPLPSFLKVTNMDNGRAVIVRVNDRGPFHGDRIIDLSETAAREIGIIAKGTGKVKLEYIDVGQNNVINNAASSIFSGTSNMPSNSSNSDAIKTLYDDLKTGNFDLGTAAAAGTLIGSAIANKEDFLPKIQNNAISTTNTSSTNAYEQVISNIANNVANAQSSIVTSSMPTQSYIQVFTSSSYDKALSIKNNLESKLNAQAQIVNISPNLFRVLLVPKSTDNTVKLLEQVKSLGYGTSFIKNM